MMIDQKNSIYIYSGARLPFLSSSCRNTHCQINKEMKRLKSQRHEQRVWLAKSVYRIFIHIVE